jgi:hypothetical protein
LVRNNIRGVRRVLAVAQSGNMQLDIKGLDFVPFLPTM